jgi:hypothetical protein
MRIAMWSGPRNLSTAMMYSFAARGDCAVWDEPFYGVYLKQTGLDHPMQTEILDACETEAGRVSQTILGPVPGGKPHFYHKHMTQHMLPGIDLSFVKECVNVFLIRHPARVIASYHAKRENPTEADLGFQRQAKLYDEVAQITGSAPIIVDSADIRANPRGTLAALCAAIGLPFTEAMLSWPAGGHKDDGVWAPHWYAAAHSSTEFGGAEGPPPPVPNGLAEIFEQALPCYERLTKRSLLA